MAGATLFWLSDGYAEGVSPYLPIGISPLLENEVERLASVSGIPNLTKPYSLATIFLYMEKIRDSHPRLYSRLNLSLKPHARRFALTHASASVRVSDDEQAMPNAHGRRTNTHGYASVRGQWQMADWLALYLGAGTTSSKDATLEDSHSANGSTLSMGVEWAQLDIGYRDMWLSPFQGSAQLLSTNAEPMPSISLSNNLPIEFLGLRWNYLGFLSQMSRQLVTYREGEAPSDKDKPLLAGFHLSVQPKPWWTLGASRVFQFGGGERPVSAGTLARAFVDPRGSDNDANVEEESGNQIAAVSSKINFDGDIPFSFALELAGEDTSNNKSYQLGNTALTAGLYFPYFMSDAVSFAFEYSDWQDAWYTNNVYEKGYVNDGFVLGHWAMQTQRDLDIAVEGTSYFAKGQWQRSNDHVVIANVRTAKYLDTGVYDFDERWEVELDYVFPWRKRVVTIGAYFGKDDFGEEFSQFRMSIEK
ncbi:MAG: capsule assembly Wzi family protein [Agarilytica sp.]